MAMVSHLKAADEVVVSSVDAPESCHQVLTSKVRVNSVIPGMRHRDLDGVSETDVVDVAHAPTSEAADVMLHLAVGLVRFACEG